MSKKGTELVISDSFTQDALAKLDAEFKNLKEIQESVYKTTGKKVPGFNNQVESETSIGQLIMMYSSVAGRDEGYIKAMTELGIEIAPEFKLEGYSRSNWKDDINLRISIMQTQERYNNLSELKKEANALMSNEDRKRILAAKIAAL